MKSMNFVFGLALITISQSGFGIMAAPEIPTNTAPLLIGIAVGAAFWFKNRK